MTGQEIEAQYKARYEQLLIPLCGRLEDHLKDIVSGCRHIDRVVVRAKTVMRFLQKAQKSENGVLKYTEPLDQIQDQVAARIVTFYLSDVEAVSAKVVAHIAPIEALKVVPDSPKEFGYEGKHYILFIPEDVKDPGVGGEECPSVFELQIKTLFQHAWSEAEHDLSYKPTGNLTSDQRRLVAFTAAQAWGADRIFQELAHELLEEHHFWAHD